MSDSPGKSSHIVAREMAALLARYVEPVVSHAGVSDDAPKTRPHNKPEATPETSLHVQTDAMSEPVAIPLANPVAKQETYDVANQVVGLGKETSTMGMTQEHELWSAARGAHGELLFLLKMGDLTDKGYTSKVHPDSVPIWDVGAAIGLSEIEAESIASDLQEQALIAYSSLAGDIALTELGRSELALLYARPDTPTQRFPALTALLRTLPVHVIPAEPVPDADGQVTLATATCDNPQPPAQLNEPLADFVGQLEACCGDLHIGQTDEEPREIPLDKLQLALDQQTSTDSEELIDELHEVASSLS